jgi:cell division protein FtsI (penicillin-binding protein 3)
MFATIGAEVLRYLGVPPRDAAPVQIVTGAGSEGRPDAPASRADGPRLPVRLVAGWEPTADEGPRMPDVRGLSVRTALAALEPLGVQIRLAGRGAVVEQTPPAGAPVRAGAVVKLALAPGRSAPGSAAAAEGATAASGRRPAGEAAVGQAGR